MEQLRRAMANIQQSMGQLGATQKLLFASLAVIAAMTLFLVSRYASKPALVDLMAQGSSTQTVQILNAAGINATVQGDRIMVPPDQQHAAVAALGDAGQLPGDTTLLFNNLIQSQDWKSSREQHRQQRVIALQNELSKVISMFRGINRAVVILDVPEAAGLGRAVREPRASVTLFTSGGVPVPQATVDAAARMIAGTQAGLDPVRIEVIDGSTGQARTVSDPQTVSSGQYLDHKLAFERETQQEIERLLAYIPGVVVSVNAVVDVTRVARTEQKYLPEKNGTVKIPTRSSVTEDTTSQASRGAEPGVRSNQTADISVGSSNTGMESSKTSEESEFVVEVGSEKTETLDPRGQPTRLAASVMVPQAYFEQLVKQSRPEDQADQPVTKQEAEAVFEGMKTLIENAVLTKLETVGPDGVLQQGKVTLAMVPMPMNAVAGFSQAGFTAAGASSAGGGGVMGMFSASGMVEMIVLGVLALVSVGMMFSMVKRAGKKVELPTAEELVGLPPALDVAGDMVGEADESDSPMAGIEISDDEVKLKKMREQVAELIAQNPESAASLIGRWISEDE